MEIYAQWEILLAWLPSTDGSPPSYPHPCIYLGESARKPDHIIVLGITSDVSCRIDGITCDLPWSPTTHDETGLNKPSIACGNWVHHIPTASVRKVIGYTPNAEQAEISAIVSRIYGRKK